MRGARSATARNVRDRQLSQNEPLRAASLRYSLSRIGGLAIYSWWWLCIYEPRDIYAWPLRFFETYVQRILQRATLGCNKGNIREITRSTTLELKKTGRLSSEINEALCMRRTSAAIQQTERVHQ